MREIIRLGTILAIICAVAAGSLAWVYQTTRPIIEQRNIEEFQAALTSVLPDADEFKESKSQDGSVYAGTKAGNPVGYAIPVDAKGFGSSPISMMVGLDTTGKVLKVKIMSHGETAGLGAKIELDSFTGQFAGKTSADVLVVKQDIDAISGATISSKGATAGVRKALDLFNKVVKGESAQQVDISKIADGSYEGSAKGFSGIIKVKVAVKAGKIADIEVVEITDDGGATSKAVPETIQRIIEKQSPDVDAVSGATYASKGIMDAVRNALANAAAAKSRTTG